MPNPMLFPDKGETLRLWKITPKGIAHLNGAGPMIGYYYSTDIVSGLVPASIAPKPVPSTKTKLATDPAQAKNNGYDITAVRDTHFDDVYCKKCGKFVKVNGREIVPCACGTRIKVL